MSVPLLSAKLIELRRKHGYSQQEVADYLKLTREGYNHYERSAREPNLNVILKLCKLYNIEASELINENTIWIENELKPFMMPIAGAATIAFPSTTANLLHMLKLFTGKNVNVDLKDITKDDIALLSQYKQLDKQSQKEVQQFIKFKKSISSKKKFN